MAEEQKYVYLKENPTDENGYCEIPEGVTIIADHQFCNEKIILKKVKMASTVKYIDTWAFSGARITEIELPEGLETIGDYAFDNCYKLKKINFPASLIGLGEEVFYADTALEEINVAEDNKIFSSVQGVLLNKDKTELIYCPDAKTGVFYVPNGVKKIRAYAFAESQLDVIMVPRTVTDFGGKGFELSQKIRYYAD